MKFKKYSYKEVYNLHNARVFSWFVNGVQIVHSHSQTVENTHEHPHIDRNITVDFLSKIYNKESGIEGFNCTVQQASSWSLNLQILSM